MEIFRFTPVSKQTLWGGSRISAFKGRTPAEDECIGETWEISGIKDNESRVEGGSYHGRTLNELVRAMGTDLVGTAYDPEKSEFPVLIKFIDASKTLSLQVHPNDEVAMVQRGKKGKNEAWYVAESKDGSKIYAGLRTDLNEKELSRHIEAESIIDHVMTYDAEPGQLFYIPSGLVHAIGAGCLIIEIQDAADITYRINDFGRLDKDGNPRELHKKEAAEAAIPAVNRRNPMVMASPEHEHVLHTPHFKIETLRLEDDKAEREADGTSFHILIAAKGHATLAAEEATEPLRQSDAVLIPASLGRYRIEGDGIFLRVFL